MNPVAAIVLSCVHSVFLSVDKLDSRGQDQARTQGQRPGPQKQLHFISTAEAVPAACSAAVAVQTDTVVPHKPNHRFFGI